jgi:hypothetical protein
MQVVIRIDEAIHLDISCVPMAMFCYIYSGGQRSVHSFKSTRHT